MGDACLHGGQDVGHAPSPCRVEMGHMYFRVRHRIQDGRKIGMNPVWCGRPVMIRMFDLVGPHLQPAPGKVHRLPHIGFAGFRASPDPVDDAAYPDAGCFGSLDTLFCHFPVFLNGHAGIGLLIGITHRDDQKDSVRAAPLSARRYSPVHGLLVDGDR